MEVQGIDNARMEENREKSTEGEMETTGSRGYMLPPGLGVEDSPYRVAHIGYSLNSLKGIIKGIM